MLSEDARCESDDSCDDWPDDPPLRESDDREPELPEGDDPLSEPLDRDEPLSEPLDRDDDWLDGPDELRSELLRSELLGQLDDERSDEPQLD